MKLMIDLERLEGRLPGMTVREARPEAVARYGI